jgi:hypothetical protein
MSEYDIKRGCETIYSELKKYEKLLLDKRKEVIGLDKSLKQAKEDEKALESIYNVMLLAYEELDKRG